jgi:hypothetical protein
MVGFPLWCVYIVRRTATIKANRAGLVETKRSQKYGYLWRGTHEQFYWFRLLGFLTSFALALENVLAYNVALRTFMASLIFLVNTVLVGILWPFKKWFVNVANVLAGLGNICQILLYLSLFDDRSQDNQNKYIYFWTTLTLGVSASILIFVVRKRCPPQGSTADQKARALALQSSPVSGNDDVADDSSDDEKDKASRKAAKKAKKAKAAQVNEVKSAAENPIPTLDIAGVIVATRSSSAAVDRKDKSGSVAKKPDAEKASGSSPPEVDSNYVPPSFKPATQAEEEVPPPPVED